MNIFYKISIDHVNGNYISGWCYNRFHKSRSVVLQLYGNGQLIAETRADRFREDFKALGLHPTGTCGFEFVSSQDVGFDLHHLHEIRVKGSKSWLARIEGGQWRGRQVNISKRLKKTIFPRKKSSSTAVFMHIPKTAGTSFNTLAHSLFPKGATINHIELIPAHRYPALQQEYRFISGHLRFGLLKKYFGSDNTSYFTIVREPYQQLHSHLKWMIQTAANPDEEFFKATNKVIYNLGLKLSRVDFSSTDSLRYFVDSLDDLEAAFLDNNQTRYFLDDQPRRVIEGDLDKAAANAALFDLVGITEEYDSFVDRFKELNNIDVSTILNRLNISRAAYLFDYNDEIVCDILKPLVQVDLPLYDLIVNGAARKF